MSGASRARLWLAFVVAFACALLASPAARAQELGLSRGEYAIDGAEVTARLTFAWRDVAYVVPGLDANHDGAVTASELASARVALTAAFAARLGVHGDGVACLPSLVDASLVEEDGLRVLLRARCDAPLRAATVDLGFLTLMPLGHRHLAHVARPSQGVAGADVLLSRTQRALTLTGEAGPVTPAGAPARGPSVFGMGVEHVLTGLDHLAFLLGLVLVGGRARALLLAITAFTVGHSLSLAVATLGLWVPSARFVEPAIALSIVYVGAENVVALSRDGEVAGRWRVALPFGLVHGFGFASALRALGLPRAELPGALLRFNLGVEAGQLAALAVALPLVWLARRRGWLRERGAVVTSLALVLAGLAWFVRRLLAA